MLINIIVIFSFSLMDGQTSQHISDEFNGSIGQAVRRVISVAVGQERAQGLNIRKLGHFFEFSMLGLTSSLYALFSKKRFTRAVPDAFFLGMTVALCDETIQLHVSGRSSQVSDVWLDIFGFACLVFLTYTVRYIYISIKKRTPMPLDGADKEK